MEITKFKTDCNSKRLFSRLLKKCLDYMDNVKAKPLKNRRELPGNEEASAIRRILKNSFAATGIFPLNKFEVLKKLPGNDNKNQTVANVENVLTDYLKEKRFASTEGIQRNIKKRD